MTRVWWKEHGGHGDTENTEEKNCLNANDASRLSRHGTRLHPINLRELRVSVPSVSFPVTSKSGSHV